jgi:hypothetical protein
MSWQSLMADSIGFGRAAVPAGLREPAVRLARGDERLETCRDAATGAVDARQMNELIPALNTTGIPGQRGQDSRADSFPTLTGMQLLRSVFQTAQERAWPDFRWQ